MIFNDRIRILRDEQKLTQSQVAQQIGIATRNYQRLESEDHVPSYQTLLALAGVYNVSADYLMGRTDKRELNR